MRSSRQLSIVITCHWVPVSSVLNAGELFRIGHLGWLNEIMVMQALGGVELAMRDVGVPFQSGAGVGAAVDYYTSMGTEAALLLNKNLSSSISLWRQPTPPQSGGVFCVNAEDA